MDLATNSTNPWSASRGTLRSLVSYSLVELGGNYPPLPPITQHTGSFCFSRYIPVAQRPSSSCHATLPLLVRPPAPTPSLGSTRPCRSSHRLGMMGRSRSPPCRSPSSPVAPLLRGGRHGGPSLQRNDRWRVRRQRSGARSGRWSKAC
jgi:hypothetical protein